MKKEPVVFVAFQEQDNLGVGYVASILREAGFPIKMIDFRVGKERILEELQLQRPLIVGFSIIFQYHIDVFKDLIHYLRDHGIRCHFNAGGHYPSLRHLDLLDMIPALDSITLFEGENTFLDLARSIYAHRDWKHTQGIAYREDGLKVTNPLRPLETDLDNFPPPVRQPLKEYALGRRYATLLAGRGCVYNCSFCSVREFYSRPPGPVKRLRRPEMVAREMELLHEQMGCTIFMFQDDDFPVARNRGRDWVTKFCQILTDKGLPDRILWKINCRPDEIGAETFRMMKECGLFLVYLGIESGTDEGLRLMNKHIKAQDNLRAVEILKDLGILYDYGFMLFDPSSTRRSILKNLDFLEAMCGDGSSPITFCKMLPYAETQIEHVLKKEGRLKGGLGFQDYDFLDLPLNDLYAFMAECFADWIGDHDGLLNMARWARYYWAVYDKFYPQTSPSAKVDKTIQGLISQSNRYFIDTVRRLIALFGSDRGTCDMTSLVEIKEDVAGAHSKYQKKLSRTIDRIEAMAGRK